METENLAHAQSASKRLIVFAPNWLGDAVMALPAIDDVRRHAPGASISVAARPSIAPLFALVPGIRDVVVVDRQGAGWRDGVRQLREGAFDTALLLPNSLQSAVTAWRAGIPERWGYRTQGRAPLLTRAVRAPAPRAHQALYYQRLTEALGFAPGPLVPRLDAPADAHRAAADLLASAGWNGRSPLVALAPGAAYGGAKRWPAASFAALATVLASDGVMSVLVGGEADADAGAAVVGTGTVLGDAPGTISVPINLIGRTDLPMLAGVLAQCRALVSNDSGAMHVGAALGVPLVAIFGPTNERETRPLGRLDPVLLSHDVWCRPCMLRECPLTHRCMRGVGVETVLAAVRGGVVTMAAVFLDRDGTLIEEIGYLDRPERVDLYPWSIDAIRAFNRAGLRVVMVTNQSGVARGFFTEEVVDQVHRHIASLLEAGGAHIDAYYYCPHHPDGKVARYARACDCRKPSRGLVDRAQRELGIDPRRSFAVGDRWLDIALARTVGARGILVRTGYGAGEEARPQEGLAADAVVNNLAEAAGWILRSLKC